jgi:hypothetical protein
MLRDVPQSALSPVDRKIGVYHSLSAFVGGEQIKSLTEAPILEDHKIVTNVNMSDIVGHVIGTPTFEKGKIYVQMAISNDGIIDKILQKQLAEISIGISSNFSQQRGNFAGKEYEYVVDTVLYNHIALLPTGKGRMKGKAKLLFAEKEPTEEETKPQETTPTVEEPAKPQEITPTVEEVAAQVQPEVVNKVNKYEEKQMDEKRENASVDVEKLNEMKAKIREEVATEFKKSIEYSQEIEKCLGSDTWSKNIADAEEIKKKFYGIFGIQEKEETLAAAIKVMKKCKDLWANKVSYRDISQPLQKGAQALSGLSDVTTNEISKILKRNEEERKILFSKGGKDA